MSYSEDFTDYNRRYLELRDIFEFLFPISRDGESLTMGARNHNVFLFKKNLDKDNIDDMEDFLVMNKHILSNKKERSFIEHNSYKIENELWYNLIFTLYKNSKKEEFSFKTRAYAEEIDTNCFPKSFQSIFKLPDILTYFSIMDKFTPFSTLGFWLYLRMHTGIIPAPIPAPVIFHGQNPRLGGLQDILYQISFAIQKEKKVYINNIGPFKFKEIVYEDISLMQRKNNPYIIATYNKKNRNKIFKIYIQGDMDLKTSNNIIIKTSLENAEAAKSVKVLHYKTIYTYNFYLISNKKDIINDYLLDKVEIEGKWFDKNVHKSKRKFEKTLDYDFQYYNYGKEWDVFFFEFKIKEKDKLCFERWADSFGNFALWEIKAKQDSYEEPYLYFSINKDTRIRDMDERCINCEAQYKLFEKCEKCKDRKEVKEKMKDVKCKKCEAKHKLSEECKNCYIEEKYENTFPTLLREENSYKELHKKKNPVSILELNWLLYVMTHYPNFTKVFLCATKACEDGKLNTDKAGKYIEKGISCVKEYIQSNPNEGKAEDNPFKTFPGLPVDDLNSCHCVKLHAIIQGIKEKNYYQCGKYENGFSKENKHNEILPYAVSFDIVNYNTSNGKGITIMAYDLVQKRVVAIPFKNFTYGKSEEGSDGIIEYEYGQYDKLYYFCSYFCKLYKKDKENACELARLITKKDFPDGFYNKKIIEDFPDVLKNTTLFKNSIKPWTDYMENSSTSPDNILYKSYSLQHNGISLFTEEEINYKNIIGKTIFYFWDYREELYNLIDDDICTELISGDTREAIMAFLCNMEDNGLNINNFQVTEEKILNEIQYTNSVLKIHELIFFLKKEIPDPDDITLVYDYFRNYNCAGKKINGKYCFKIQFEGFEYRKIHEIALALNGLIEIPEEAAFSSGYQKTHSIAYMEQQNQSRLLRYRSVEGKEELKKKLKEFLQNC
ncbi:MAG: hypothetical protein K1W24_12625 [Lachnospiraceae bacterium]